MLGHPHTLIAILLREVDFPQRLLDDLAVRRGAPARKELEHADVHPSFAFDLHVGGCFIDHLRFMEGV